jgi:hypothetical protein
MKKSLLLSALGSLLLSQAAFAQSPRMNILEEFTSANCGPCAQTNPGLLAVIKANESKIFIMKYQHKIPAADPMYLQAKEDIDPRASYYSVNYNPFGKVNGKKLAPGANYEDHPGYFNQSSVDALPSTSPFELSINTAFNPARDSVFAVISIKCTEAYNGTTVKLRGALLETLTFDSAPGANGEKKFENVVRKMYPSAAGTELEATWTVGKTKSITLAGKVPSYVNVNSSELHFAAFIQDDANKEVAQAGIVPLTGTTSINDIVSDQSLNVFPNPATSSVNVEFDAKKSGSATISVTNILGQQVSTGVYILNINTGEGSLQRKFVKK